jgi:hypothetical protein
MRPRCWLPRRSWRLEHNQCHGPFNFYPTCFRQSIQSIQSIQSSESSSPFSVLGSLCASLTVGFFGSDRIDKLLKDHHHPGLGLPAKGPSHYPGIHLTHLIHRTKVQVQFGYGLTLEILDATVTSLAPRSFVEARSWTSAEVVVHRQPTFDSPARTADVRGCKCSGPCPP